MNCKFCNREFVTNGIYVHQMYCKLNPNRKINGFTGKTHTIKTKRRQAMSFFGKKKKKS